MCTVLQSLAQAHFDNQVIAGKNFKATITNPKAEVLETNSKLKIENEE
jgi:hypothetical protein